VKFISDCLTVGLCDYNSPTLQTTHEAVISRYARMLAR